MSISFLPARSDLVLGHLRHFEGLYRQDPDPWRARETWSERHKRRTVQRALGATRCGLGLELGCGNGVTTRELACRFAHLVAVDGSPMAIAHARRELAGLSNVELRQQELPARLPQRRFDVIIASEILYYLPPSALASTLRCVYQALRRGGRFVSTHHWRRFDDAEVSHARLTEITRGIFGLELRRIAGAGWRCDVFVRRTRR